MMKEKMKMNKNLLVGLVSLFAIAILASCTPEQVAIFNRLPKSGQEAVIAHLQRASRDCNEAIDKHFSGDKARMKRIVWRESRNNPAAANPRSTARGCAQMMMSYHHGRFAAVGCPNVGTRPWRDASRQWADPDCNIKAANHLYRQAGWSPWAQTDY